MDRVLSGLPQRALWSGFNVEPRFMRPRDLALRACARVVSIHYCIRFAETYVGRFARYE